MAQTDTTALADQIQRLYSPKLLTQTMKEIRLNEFALQADLPKNAGSKSVRYFRRRKADADNVQTLTEGGSIANLTVHSVAPYAYVDVDLAQIGDVHKITDIAGWVSIMNLVKDSVEVMGEEAAIKADTITRNVVVTGQDQTGHKRYAGSAANFAALQALSAANSELNGTELFKAATQLKTKDAPKIGGYYVAVIPPEGSFDFMEDTANWVDVNKYNNAEQIFKGEIGRWKGVRIVEANNPYRENGAGAEGTFVSDGNIFTSLVFGKDAFGVPKLAGTSTPWKPQVILVDKPDSNNPLQQYKLLGWKAFYNSVLLNKDFLVTVRHKTTFA